MPVSYTHLDVYKRQHLSILIETMRREGYELQVSPPHVLTKVIDGKTYEPMEPVSYTHLSSR